VRDSMASDSFALAFYIPHIFRMVLFFTIAGFFARLAYEKRGALGFGIDRIKRIALPLASFWMPVFAAIVAVLIWGAVKANGGEMPEAPEQPGLSAENFPLTHLWFLYLLCLFYPVAMVLRGAFRLIDRNDVIGGLVDRLVNLITLTPLGLFVLAVPLTLAFMQASEWMMWFGIPTPDTGLIPNTVALTGYGTAFTFGWLLHRQADLLKRFQTWWPIYLSAAVVLTWACLNQTGYAPNFNMGDDTQATWLYAAGYASAGWAWSLGLIGVGLSLFGKANRAVRYLADASYWIYIIHLPAVMALQVAVSDIALPALVKFGLINAITLCLALATYHFVVRNTWLGGWINGRRHGKSETVKTDAALPDSATA